MYGFDSIVLGTAQMSGFLYGGLKTPLTREDSYRIWDAAWEMGVRAFDTAESYGAAADRLEAWLRQNRHTATITTKVTPRRGLNLRTRGAARRFHGHAVTVLSHGCLDEAGWGAMTWFWPHCGMSVYTREEVIHARAMGVTHIQDPLSWLAPDLLHDRRSVFAAGTNVQDPAAQIRAALSTANRLVIGVDCVSHLEAIAHALS